MCNQEEYAGKPNSSGTKCSSEASWRVGFKSWNREQLIWGFSWTKTHWQPAASALASPVGESSKANTLVGLTGSVLWSDENRSMHTKYGSGCGLFFCTSESAAPITTWLNIFPGLKKSPNGSI